ncbi:uncharacterized protein METZ01_LOCUS6902 [marine metagenome]|uniref:Uncharacterized protein n=1 Tax=marine metagenome TaxID=408172 RepID=A0A381NJK8_9ZZZZ
MFRSLRKIYIYSFPLFTINSVLAHESMEHVLGYSHQPTSQLGLIGILLIISSPILIFIYLKQLNNRKTE